MIVELGDEVKAWGVYPGGQSGNPGSKYYDMMVSQWSEGKYNSLFFMKNKDDRSQEVLFDLKMGKK
ncbi:MAG: penicillin acylase family protein [Saprospiraceae bacterium]|nr:penicillin acylase family protein [Saprospiraceae bacterium]